MDLEDRVREAILAELQRQADRPDLVVRTLDPPFVDVRGRIDLDELAMALVGTLAGGP